ncbi:hypothetical protein SCP_1102600 [Sparassis crispa]|uniref:Snurportin-1 n=1 Tax=Sparassis crispa TaxID=139825 RepID=A0A401GZI7_9APHY|nr:hypothetical protein SCP_1102600 [Sparassis crispa]GBE87583.1 hypothetical protein SCP_1102600 [Sparassis crispa]
MFHDRKASYKTPPATVRDAHTSQEQRRNKALEEQKRRRAQRVDATRQLDFFADMNLGPSDDEVDEDGALDGPEVLRSGVASFTSMLPSDSTVLTANDAGAVTKEHTFSSESAISPLQASNVQTTGKKRGKNKRKAKARHSNTAAGSGSNKARITKPSRWADKCMYAELLEMVEGFDQATLGHDGIPEDIETSWVAVTPVPVGKRCLAVTHQAAGIAGVVPNTTLRSRVLGKPLMKPFPSPLPPQTVLDCILDENWKDTGILHVLDVLQWKGQDVGECETPFRFWWRDTRLSELPSFPPPPSASEPQAEQQQPPYQFPYPATFVPIPYHTNTTLLYLANTLIPLTRASRYVPVSTPIPSRASVVAGTMDLGGAGAVSPLIQLHAASAEVKSDGLLLYVAQATYEPGTSPLSSWVPLRAYSQDTRYAGADTGEMVSADAGMVDSPLDLFERLIRRRLAAGHADGFDVTMDVGS